MAKYDAVVVGAGNAGPAAALFLGGIKRLPADPSLKRSGSANTFSALKAMALTAGRHFS